MAARKFAGLPHIGRNFRDGPVVQAHGPRIGGPGEHLGSSPEDESAELLRCRAANRPRPPRPTLLATREGVLAQPSSSSGRRGSPRGGSQPFRQDGPTPPRARAPAQVRDRPAEHVLAAALGVRGRPPRTARAGRLGRSEARACAARGPRRARPRASAGAPERVTGPPSPWPGAPPVQSGDGADRECWRAAGRVPRSRRHPTCRPAAAGPAARRPAPVAAPSAGPANLTPGDLLATGSPSSAGGARRAAQPAPASAPSTARTWPRRPPVRPSLEAGECRESCVGVNSGRGRLTGGGPATTSRTG